jgi:hypothetical protein
VVYIYLFVYRLRLNRNTTPKKMIKTPQFLNVTISTNTPNFDVDDVTISDTSIYNKGNINREEYFGYIEEAHTITKIKITFPNETDITHIVKNFETFQYPYYWSYIIKSTIQINGNIFEAEVDPFIENSRFIGSSHDFCMCLNYEGEMIIELRLLLNPYEIRYYEDRECKWKERKDNEIVLISNVYNTFKELVDYIHRALENPEMSDDDIINFLKQPYPYMDVIDLMDYTLEKEATVLKVFTK